MPAPPGNTNAATHGLRLTVSRVPVGAEYVAKAVYKFRGLVETAVVDRHGAIDVYRASLIQSACRWELHSRLASRWLKIAHDQLTAGEKLNYSREAARASSERDRCLKELGLDRADTADVFDALYADVPTTPKPNGNGNGDQAAHGDAVATPAADTTKGHARGREHVRGRTRGVCDRRAEQWRLRAEQPTQ